MDVFDRLYRLHGLLENRSTPIARAELTRRLECSSATLTRTIRMLRDYLGAPIENEPGVGYRYEPYHARGYQLPGLWFSAEELQALLLLEQLLEDLQPGLLDEHLAPLRHRIARLLDRLGPGTANSLSGRIQLLHASTFRRLPPENLRQITAGLLSGCMLDVSYQARADGRLTKRKISPQRLLYYRENWYLVAWCHMRHGLRSFAVEQIQLHEQLEEPCKPIAATELDQHLLDGFGVFSGSRCETATLRFSPRMARWVKDEVWHSAQHGELLTDGSYELNVPYANPTELIGEILRHGVDVEVLAPPSLRKAVRDELLRAAKLYTNDHDLSIESDKGCS